MPAWSIRLLVKLLHYSGFRNPTLVLLDAAGDAQPLPFSRCASVDKIRLSAWSEDRKQGNIEAFPHTFTEMHRKSLGDLLPSFLGRIIVLPD